MPKSQLINPNEVRKSGYVKFKDIPVNQYDKSIKDEKGNFSNEDFIRIYRDMAIIREFESMLLLIKTTGEYNGVKYNNPGPAHLSLGQEASAVGQAYLLSKEDYIFGSHRSHGEILAKGLSCIYKMEDDELYAVMKNFMGGTILKIVEAGQSSIKDIAVDFGLRSSCRNICKGNGIP